MSLDMGDVVYEASGRVTSKRILDTREGKSVIEYGYEGSGTIAGQDMTDAITYEVEEVSEGSFIASNVNGVAIIDDGGVVLWRGRAAAVRAEGAAELVWRGFMVAQTQSPKLSELDGVILDGIATINDDNTVVLRARRWK